MSSDISGKTFVRRVTLCEDENEEDLDAATLDIHQLMVGDVGCVVWDAAIVLSHVLARSEAFQDVAWSEKFVVELGSGTGLVGLAAAMVGCEVILTDLPECVELMEFNCTVNKTKLRGSARAAVLAWGVDLAPFRKDGRERPIDLILMADVIYYDASVGPLLDTLQALSSDDTQILMSYEDRTLGNKVQLKEQFFLQARETFLVEELPQEIIPESFRCPEIHIVAMKRKSAAQL